MLNFKNVNHDTVWINPALITHVEETGQTLDAANKPIAITTVYFGKASVDVIAPAAIVAHQIEKATA